MSHFDAYDQADERAASPEGRLERLEAVVKALCEHLAGGCPTACVPRCPALPTCPVLVAKKYLEEGDR